MLAIWQEDSLLGSYQERDYSKGFQKMMSNVVAKIYRNKKTKQNVFKTLAPISSHQKTSKRESIKNHFSEEASAKVKTPRVSSYYQIFPKSSGVVLRHENSSKSSLPIFKVSQNCNKISLKSKQRFHSIQLNKYPENLYKKITSYNASLITKTYKLQQKTKLTTDLYDTEQSEEGNQQRSLFVSKIRKKENFKRSNRWIHTKGKFIKQSALTTERKEEFKPWQIDHYQQFQY